MTCVFCDISAGLAPAHVVDESELAIALLDINPFTEGHCLVISRRHVQWWHDLNDEEIASVFQMAKRVAVRLEKTFSPEFVGMYARGRRIPHTHIFLVPTTKGDVLDGFFNALERFQEAPGQLAALKTSDALAATATRIRSSG